MAYLEKINLVDDDVYAYLIINKNTLEILDGNKLAKYYCCSETNYVKFEHLFKDAEAVAETIKKETDELSISMYDVHMLNFAGVEFSCDMEICFLDKNNDNVFIVLKDKQKDDDRTLNEIVELEDNPVLVLETNNKYVVKYANLRFYHTIGKEQNDSSNSSPTLYTSLLEEARSIAFVKDIEQQLELGDECSVDIEMSIDEFYQLFHYNAFRSVIDGNLYGVLISIRKQSELMKKIEYDQQYFDIMQEFSKDLLFRIDVKNKTLVHRGDISSLADLTPEMDNFPECMRENDLVHPDDLEGYIAFAYRMIHGMGAVYEPRFQFNDGSYEKYRLQGKPLFDAEGNTIQVVGKSENIQKYVEIETRANYDALTTALNKQSFRELVENLLSRAVEKDKFALLFIDFDDFKRVNDTMGHVFGDFLLEVTGKRIINSVRNHDKVGRVGGDEFVVFFQHAPSSEAVLERADSILHSLRREFNNGNKTYSMKASVGIALYPDHGVTYEELYHHADIALYHSKKLGKDIATIYNKELTKKK